MGVGWWRLLGMTFEPESSSATVIVVKFSPEGLLSVTIMLRPMHFAIEGRGFLSSP